MIACPHSFALLFILYLAHALKPEQSPEDQELRENIINGPNPTAGRKESNTLERQYADYMFTITRNIEEKERLKREVPPQLKKFNLGAIRGLLTKEATEKLMMMMMMYTLDKSDSN